MRTAKPRTRQEALISASEIACYAYCPEQWRLEYGLGLHASNQSARKAGTRHHGRKAVAERLAGGVIGFGRLMVAIGLAVLMWRVWCSR